MKEILKKMCTNQVGTVLVIGDLMLDSYTTCSETFSRNENVKVLKKETTSHFPGGAANLALNIAKLEVDTILLGTVGYDTEAGILLQLLKDDVNIQHVQRDKCKRTTVKTRLVSLGGETQVRLDEEDTADIGTDLTEQLLLVLENLLGDIRCVVISDYQKGIANKHFISSIIHRAAAKKIPVFVDTKNQDIEVYRGVNLITPNMDEFQQLTQSGSCTLKESVLSAAEFLRNYQIEKMILKNGPMGSALIEGESNKFFITQPVEQTNAECSIGAGDCLLGAFTAAYVKGLDEGEAFQFANYAASLSIKKPYTSAMSLSELLDLQGLLVRMGD